jgi:hypothetical protein
MVTLREDDAQIDSPVVCPVGAVMGNACRQQRGGHLRAWPAPQDATSVPTSLVDIKFIFHGTLDSMNLQESHWLSWTPRGRDPPRWHTHRGRHRRPVGVPNRIELRFCMAFPAALIV